MASVVITYAVLLILPAGLALAAISDLTRMTIPNAIPAVVLLSFFALAPFVGLGWPDIGMSLVAGLAVFAVCFSLFAANVMGGGDAKLLTAAACWFGFNQSLLMFLVATAFLGGVLTIAILVIRAHSNTVLAMGVALPKSLTTANKIPYGIGIAVAGFMTYEHAPIVALAMRAAG
ncbi:prepilin peptidase CpaA [Neorhizobium huautlense]|uniref:Prepilin peptidase CpaA n=1 Tax=Neorhizobium huautlense TaxID=67774 RepID=A0ABT9PVS1_9HYPH|nr:prepilin peptidase [Neorhizobium huautlense]MDP9838547.1 prepilin peptidase CpaA [Neorhizobium huautlense]